MIISLDHAVDLGQHIVNITNLVFLYDIITISMTSYDGTKNDSVISYINYSNNSPLGDRGAHVKLLSCHATWNGNAIDVIQTIEIWYWFKDVVVSLYLIELLGPTPANYIKGNLLR